MRLPLLDVVGQQRRPVAVPPDLTDQVDHRHVRVERLEEGQPEVAELRPVPEDRLEGVRHLRGELVVGDAAAFELEQGVLAGLLGGAAERLGEVLRRDPDRVLYCHERLDERGGQDSTEVRDDHLDPAHGHPRTRPAAPAGPARPNLVAPEPPVAVECPPEQGGIDPFRPDFRGAARDHGAGAMKGCDLLRGRPELEGRPALSPCSVVLGRKQHLIESR